MKLNEVYEELTEEQFDEKAGKKDACYHKVKARYKIWPQCICQRCISKMQKSWCQKLGK